MASVIHILSARLRRHSAVNQSFSCIPTGAEGNDCAFHEWYFLPQKFALNKSLGLLLEWFMLGKDSRPFLLAKLPMKLSQFIVAAAGMAARGFCVSRPDTRWDTVFISKRTWPAGTKKTLAASSAQIDETSRSFGMATMGEALVSQLQCLLLVFPKMAKGHIAHC